jgi:hypothetical protein
MQQQVMEWLLEEENPEVRLRTLKEFYGYDKDHPEVIRARQQLLDSPLYDEAMEKLKGDKKWGKYDALISFAEWGLTREEIEIDEYVFALIKETGFKMLCGEGLLLRNLVKLGYYTEPIVKEEVNVMFSKLKSDGGFGCISKNKKINDPAKEHKSCVKITLGYLLLLAELKLQSVDIACEQELVNYFTKRNLFYRTDNRTAVMVPVMTETFYPPDAIQVGVQNLIYALSILGQGDSEAAKQGWKYLNLKRDSEGIYKLSKTKTIPAFKPGKKNKPNKWITLYALLTEERTKCE